MFIHSLLKVRHPEDTVSLCFVVFLTLTMKNKISLIFDLHQLHTLSRSYHWNLILQLNIHVTLPAEVQNMAFNHTLNSDWLAGVK